MTNQDIKGLLQEKTKEVREELKRVGMLEHKIRLKNQTIGMLRKELLYWKTPWFIRYGEKTLTCIGKWWKGQASKFRY